MQQLQYQYMSFKNIDILLGNSDYTIYPSLLLFLFYSTFKYMIQLGNYEMIFIVHWCSRWLTSSVTWLGYKKYFSSYFVLLIFVVLKVDWNVVFYNERTSFVC